MYHMYTSYLHYCSHNDLEKDLTHNLNIKTLQKYCRVQIHRRKERKRQMEIACTGQLAGSRKNGVKRVNFGKILTMKPVFGSVWAGIF